MDDFVEEQGKSFVHDLQKIALNNSCYIGWVSSGLGLGALAGSSAAGIGAVPGVLIGGVAGLIWAAKTCKPLVGAASERMTTSYLTEGELQHFESRLQQYAPVTREQSLALAKMALDAYPQPHSAPPPIDFGSELKRFLQAS